MESTVICGISLDRETLATLDNLAQRLGLSRSATIRLLARAFAEQGLRLPPSQENNTEYKRAVRTLAGRG